MMKFTLNSDGTLSSSHPLPQEVLYAVHRGMCDAVLNERRECAKMADDYAKLSWSANPSAQEAAVAAEHIAQAIRNRL